MDKKNKPDESGHSRYGLTESAWADLSPVERETHYNRHRPAWAAEYDGTKVPEGLRESYSFDPYAHTAVMIPCTRQFSSCGCQTCVRGIGRERTK